MGRGRQGRAIVFLLPLLKRRPPSLSFLSIKCLPFGRLPSSSIIKTFSMSEEVEAEEQREIEVALNSISQRISLGATCPHQQAEGEGRRDK